MYRMTGVKGQKVNEQAVDKTVKGQQVLVLENSKWMILDHISEWTAKMNQDFHFKMEAQTSEDRRKQAR